MSSIRRRNPGGVAIPAALAAAVAPAGPVLADTVTVGASKDNTLIESREGVFSNGAGTGVFAGRTGQFSDSIRRGVMAFDLAESIPPGARITAVTLRLHMTMTIVGAQPVSLHRLLADWGEGDSAGVAGGGGGAPADIGDATWQHTFFPKAFWTNDGGDFTAAPSASIIVGNVGFYTWGSTPEMVADVQAWVNDPGQNFGWLLQGNETTFPTAKRFDSREVEEPETRPQLTVEFEACPPDTDGSGAADVDDLINLILDWGTDGSKNNGDINNDGIVDVDDLVLLLLAWGPCP